MVHSNVNDETKWKDDLKGEVFYSLGKSRVLRCFDLFYRL